LGAEKNISTFEERRCTTVTPPNMFRILNQDWGRGEHITCMEGKKGIQNIG
jgi:hypothetical protein